MARTTSILHDDQYIFMILFRSLLLTIRDISDKNCR